VLHQKHDQHRSRALRPPSLSETHHVGQAFTPGPRLDYPDALWLSERLFGRRTLVASAYELQVAPTGRSGPRLVEPGEM